MEPAAGVFTPVMLSNKVVLPAPLGPMSPLTWPDGTDMVTLSTATTPPNRTVTPSTAKRGWPDSAGRSATAVAPSVLTSATLLVPNQRREITESAMAAMVSRLKSMEEVANPWLNNQGTTFKSVTPSSVSRSTSPSVGAWLSAIMMR